MRLCLLGPLRQLLLLALLYLKVVCVLCDNFCGALSRAARALSCTFALSISLSLYFSVGGRLNGVAHVRVSQHYAHTHICMHTCECLHVHTHALSCSVIVRERERKKKSASQGPNAHSLILSLSVSHATQTFPIHLITTRALFPSSSSNLSYSRILLSGVCCTYIFLCHCLFACQHKLRQYNKKNDLIKRNPDNLSVEF